MSGSIRLGAQFIKANETRALAISVVGLFGCVKLWQKPQQRHQPVPLIIGLDRQPLLVLQQCMWKSGVILRPVPP